MDVLSLVIYLVLLGFIFLLLRKYIQGKNDAEIDVWEAVLNPEELEKHAVEIARNHVLKRKTKLSYWLIPRMNENYRYITQAYRSLNDCVKQKKPTAPSAEWLLDNFYVIEEQIQGIRQNLSRGYYSGLPGIKSGALKGYPRVYAIALELVAHTDGRFDEKLLVNFIRAYQSQTLLSSGELWAVALMVRIALIEHMRHICEKITKSQEEWAEADKLADTVIDILRRRHSPEEAVLILEENLQNIRELSPSFCEHLLQRLRKYGRESAPIMHFLDNRLMEQDTTAERMTRFEHQEQAARQISIGNSITSLRLISTLDWADIFESLSQVEQILRQDPDGTYPMMDFSSRDYYRHEVEKLSKIYNVAETLVARKAIECAAETAPASDSASGSVSDEPDRRSRHVGYFISGSGKRILEARIAKRTSGYRGVLHRVLRHPGLMYTGLVILFFLFTIVPLLSYAYKASGGSRGSVFIVFIAVVIPAVELSVVLTNWLMTHIFKPKVLPKLELREGIPQEAATMVVIPTLLTNEKRVNELMDQLEVFYLANRENNLYFSILGDFKDSDEEHKPGDSEIVSAALKRINSLNVKYKKGDQALFYFFHRHRQLNTIQNKWMGWERKRGALMEFNSLLRGDSSTSISTLSADILQIPKVKYVITLDADTILPMDNARRLVGTIMHPLNRPIPDEKTGVVVEGYGLLQPRISVSILSSNKSLFSNIFAGQGGIDPYTTAISDVYQDLFGEGIFTGKGIYDVDVFLSCLKNAIPENSILSHDLLEGSYIRTGLVTDIELIDSYPSRYNAYMMRLHRWVRGDWQLLPWLCRKIRNRQGEVVDNPLSLLSKWKIFDNMRRSLIPLGNFLLVVLGLTVLPGSALIWLLYAFGVTAFPLLTGTADYLLSRRSNTFREKRHNTIICGLKAIAYQAGLLFMFYPYSAYIITDAIIRTVGRVLLTRRNMLEWVTAADVEQQLKNNASSFWKRMWMAPASALLLFCLVLAFYPVRLVYALAVILAWSLAPMAAYLISRVSEEKLEVLDADDLMYLRRLSRKTWRYFEDFVNQRENYLPPDNFQEEPPNGVAHRTSPTNIGLLLVSTMAARDLGYLSLIQMAELIEKTLAVIEKMEKWKGHLYNWYDTRTLHTLRPLYVSTVDSGNFIGYLMTLKQGLKEYMNRPILDGAVLRGLQDTLLLAREEKGITDLHEEEIKKLLLHPENPVIWKRTLEGWKKKHDSASGIRSRRRESWEGRFYQMAEALYRDLDELMPWSALMEELPGMLIAAKHSDAESISDMALKEAGAVLWKTVSRLSEKSTLAMLPEVIAESVHEVNGVINGLEQMKKGHYGLEEMLSWSRRLHDELERAKENAGKVAALFTCLTDRIEKIVDSTEFTHLFDPKRQLFSIGYNVEEGLLSKSYYDLLASEARQTSFISIARGEVKQKHWFRLGRTLTIMDRYKGLVSWTGTMFEYLMPLLIMKNYENTLMDETYSFVVHCQKKYGQIRNVPWGTSESGYSAFDINLNYQYKAFGVPELGLKRGLVNDMVVAPYATVLALPVKPADAMENLRVLSREGLEGAYGFFEAVDYTPERLSKGKKNSVVKSYMVHHQGMSLLALDNYLNQGIMQERFHADPVIKAAEFLLQERVPERVFVKKEAREEVTPLRKVEYEDVEVVRTMGLKDKELPEVHFLSNGSYSVMLTNDGSGYSRDGDIAVTRWREDIVNRNYGMFFYIQNINSNSVWSAAYEPYNVEADEYKVIFSPDKVEFLRRDGNIDTHTQVIVSPEDHAEIRKLSLTNRSGHDRIIEVTSYFEAVLSHQSADVAHPAFNNLFVRTEFLPQYNTLLAVRRPREEKGRHHLGFHTLLVEGEKVGGMQFETDRSRFTGRGRTLRNPAAMDVDMPLSNTTGAVLDPIMSLRQRVRIKPGETVHLSFTAGTAESRENAIMLADKYNEPASIARAFEMAWTRSQVEARYLNLKAEETLLFQQMLPHILYLSPLRRKRENYIAANTKGQMGLWSYGISGDIPIVLVTLRKKEQADIVHQMLKAHEYWRTKGLKVDLVILNEDASDYIQPLQDMLRDIISISHARDIMDTPGGVFLRHAGVIPEEDRNLLFTVAKLVLRGEDGPPYEQIELDEEENSQVTQVSNGAVYSYEESVQPRPEAVREKVIRRESHGNCQTAINLKKNELIYFNGLGGFSKDGKEYVILLEKGQHTPAPWVNVIANDKFGFLTTESGGGYTWSENSRENKLTPWSNDPITDPGGETFYLWDSENGEVWSFGHLPGAEAGEVSVPPCRIVTHGFGYTRFENGGFGLKQELTEFVPVKDPVKISLISLKNQSERQRKLTITRYIRPVLGVSEQVTAPFIVTQFDGEAGLLIRNTYTSEFPGRSAFLGTSEKEFSYTGDRSEFIGSKGNTSIPLGLNGQMLSGRTGAGLDPCAVVQVQVELQPGEEKEIVFLLGHSKSLEQAKEISVKYRQLQTARNALQEVKDFWQQKLGVLQVNTPDQSMNILLNGWLLYQTLACRIWARSAFYQSGGAYGFRDQLQDTGAIMHIWPEITRKQIILHAGHQFQEGDVQHWWHDETGKGIRTRFSDDLVWLPYITADYVSYTGDASVLDEEAYYLWDRPLEENEDERYSTTNVSEEKGPVYQHCIRAIERALHFGERGIPLMGSGDWNDGMNMVGNKGKGESVWLGWFLQNTLAKFIPVCRLKGDNELADKYTRIAGEILENIEQNAWDGSWYRRAYFDNGAPLGSAQNTECRIDSLAQSWAVIAGGAKPNRVLEGMSALENYLIDREEGIIKLLTPPFDVSELNPGYIKGYVPGVRENGGQYTHAATWVILAFAKLGYGDKASELFRMINPIQHTLTLKESSRYKVEPYVMAADVYAVHPHAGRGGWTWYTGAAGWMYRVGIEYILGIQKSGDKMMLNPCIPKEWEEFNINYRYIDTSYRITVKNPKGANTGVKRILLDGNEAAEGYIKLINDNKHHEVTVLMRYGQEDGI